MLRNKFITAACFLLGAQLNAAELSTYEVPEQTKDSHEESFYEKSFNHEEALNNLQIVLIVDKSGSQQAPDSHPVSDTPAKGMLGDAWTQWDNTFYAAKYLAESIYEYDADGVVPLVFFGNDANIVEAKGVGQMLVAFKKNKPPREPTNLVSALQTAFEKYSTPQKDGERILFIVLTDGAPNAGQPEQVKQLIKENITKKTLNILFVRIGDDPGAVNFLEHLDNCAEIGDSVDTKSDNMMHKMGPKNLILNAIFEHLDKEYSE